MDNISLFFLIFNLSGRFLILDQLMLFAAVYLIYLSALPIFVFAFKGGENEKKTLLLIILAMPIAFILINLIHLVFIEIRPFAELNFSPLIKEATFYSFPSIHTTIMAVIAFAYTYLKSKWSILFLLLMLWVGISRIFVGVHYPLDILGGMIVGLISIIVAKRLSSFFQKKLFII